MRYVLYVFVMILLVSGLSFAANVTLGYSECITTGNDTICAPASNLVNETLVYKQCVNQTQSSLIDIQNTCSTFPSLIATLNNNVTSQVSKLEGVTFADKYVDCKISLNSSLKDTQMWKEETEQRDKQLEGTVKKTDLDSCQANLASTQSIAAADKTKTQDDVRNFAIVAFIVGAVGYHWYSHRTPNSSNDSRSGRSPGPGRS